MHTHVTIILFVCYNKLRTKEVTQGIQCPFRQHLGLQCFAYTISCVTQALGVSIGHGKSSQSKVDPIKRLIDSGCTNGYKSF